MSWIPLSLLCRGGGAASWILKPVTALSAGLLTKATSTLNWQVPQANLTFDHVQKTVAANKETSFRKLDNVIDTLSRHAGHLDNVIDEVLQQLKTHSSDAFSCWMLTNPVSAGSHAAV